MKRSRRLSDHAWPLIATILFGAALITAFARHENSAPAAASVSSRIAANSGNEADTPAPSSPEAAPAIAEGPAFVPADPSTIEVRLAYVSARIESSLFEDGQRAGLSDALILKLVEIFGWDIDFALNVRPGDSFAVVHEEKYWLGQKVGDGPILAAEFVSGGKPYYAFGFRDRGVTTYYELNGLTKRKRFLRTPIEFSRVSSRYTAERFHPILKRWTAHRGVDYAAPTGTPIRATAAGRILQRGVRGGYGNCIVIRHDSTYSTLYGHLSRFAANIRVGSFVEQGQIIGYVGKTGMATGPHLHYEFLLDDRHRDPLAFKSPGAMPIPDEYRQDFFARTAVLITQLDRIASRQIAANR